MEDSVYLVLEDMMKHLGADPVSCCVFAAGVFNKLKWLLAWPLCLLLYFTVPNCSTPRWDNCFMLSFTASTLWIAAFSYVMVWMVRGGRKKKGGGGQSDGENPFSQPFCRSM